MNEIQLHNLIVKYAPMLQNYFNFYKVGGIVPEALLTALAMNESSFGKNTTPRIEKAYMPGGSYFVIDQKDRYEVHGEDAAKSWGVFQVMYPVACEINFDQKPWKRKPEILSEPEINIHFCIEYIRKRCLARGDKQPSTIFDSYNSGTSRDNIKPLDYMRNGEIAYANYFKKDYTNV